jgi:hypothetical protein
MNWKQSKKSWLVAVCSAIIIYLFGRVGGFNSGMRYAEEHAPKITASDTTLFTEKEIVEVSKPPIDTPTKVITKTFYYPVHDTIFAGDSIGVDIPYIEAHASIPDTLDIYYHGYLDVGIDSINYSLFKTTEIITNNVTVEVAKLPKLAFNAGLAGLWYENKPNGLIYGKLTYTHGKTGYSAFGGYKTDFVGNNSPFFGVGIDITLPLIK